MPSTLENLVDKVIANEQIVWVKLNAINLIGTTTIDDKNILIVITKTATSPLNYKVSVTVNGGSLAIIDTGVEHITEKIDNHFISKLFRIENEINNQIELLASVL
jgi:hypothetical protein